MFVLFKDYLSTKKNVLDSEMSVKKTYAEFVSDMHLQYLTLLKKKATLSKDNLECMRTVIIQ